MNIFIDSINTDNLHHGYLIVGNREISKKALLSFLEDTLQINSIGNPDFSFSEYNILNIDEARNVAESQVRKDFGSSKKIFIISTNGITDEAQNALLKVFEEPTEGTHFFLLVSQNTFLPTFLSRLVVVKLENEKLDVEENVLEMPLPDRLAFVTKLATEISDEKKVKQDAIELVNMIERELVLRGVEKNAQAIKECSFARNALFSRGAMIKMILENLMLQIA